METPKPAPKPRTRRARNTTVCPRCGSEGSMTSKRGYIYVRHYEDGRERWCYIGPEDGYTYVSGMHGIAIDNIASEDYISLALEALEKVKELLEARKILMTSARREKLKMLIELAQELLATKTPQELVEIYEIAKKVCHDIKPKTIWITKASYTFDRDVAQLYEKLQKRYKELVDAMDEKTREMLELPPWITIYYCENVINKLKNIVE